MTQRNGTARLISDKEQPRYTLDELLAQCDPEVSWTLEEREWIDAKLAGRELI